MSASDPPKKTAPGIQSFWIPELQIHVHMARSGGDYYVPSIYAGIPQKVAKDLADRAEVDYVHHPGGLLLFPSKWLAAANPLKADDLGVLISTIHNEVKASSFHFGPNQ